MDNGGYEKNIGEKVAAISPNMLQRVMQNFQKRLGGMYWQKTPRHRHCIQEVNVVIKTLWVKDNFSNKFA